MKKLQMLIMLLVLLLAAILGYITFMYGLHEGKETSRFINKAAG